MTIQPVQTKKRREFLEGILRTSILSGIGALFFFAAFKKIPATPTRGKYFSPVIPCNICPYFKGCKLPEAKAARRQN